MDDRKHISIKVKVAIVIAVIAVIVVGAVAFANYFFKIKTINISGTERYTYEQLKSYIFSNRSSRNMIEFARSNKKVALPDIPFIAKVDIDIDWPNTINIKVYEKNIIGYVTYKGTNMYFDKDGIVAESSTEIFDDIPYVEGLKYNSIVLHEKLKVDNESIFSDINNITQYISKYAIKVDALVVADNEFKIITGDVTVLLGKNDNKMADKLYELSCMMQKLVGMKGTLHLESFDTVSKNNYFEVEE